MAKSVDGSHAYITDQETVGEQSLKNEYSIPSLDGGTIATGFDNFDDVNFPYSYDLVSQKINADSSQGKEVVLVTESVETSANFADIAVSSGGAVYALTISQDLGGYGKLTLELDYINAVGQDAATTLDTFYFGDTPLPYLHPSEPTLTHYSNNTFTVTWTEQYSEGNPDYGPFDNPTTTKSFTRLYADDGTLLTTTTVGFDGSREMDTYAPNGKLTQSQVKTTDGTTDFTYFDPATGKATGEYIRNADGSRTEVSLAVTGKSYAQQTASYDAHGKLLSLTRLYANGVTSFTQVNNPDGTETVASFDTSGRKTTTVLFASDGSRDVVLRKYAGTSVTPYSLEEVRYSANNQKLSDTTTRLDGAYEQTARVNYADGTYAKIFVDVVGDNTELFFSKYSSSGSIEVGPRGIVPIIAASGSQIGARLQADGTIRIGFAGNEPHSSESGVAVVDKTGALVSLQTSLTTSFGADTNTTVTINGVIVKQEEVQSDYGTRSDSYFDSTSGALVRSTVVDRFGNTTSATYGIVGKPYTTQATTYDTFGNLVSLTRFYADGSTQLSVSDNSDGTESIVSFDPQERVVDQTTKATDGSRVVVQDSYTGTSNTPSLVQESDYNPANQKVAINVTHADGSHIQSAFASGLTLTSTADAPDTFTSASTGGDTFVFKPAFGQDIITNFHAGSGAGHDVVDFTAFHAQLGSAQSQSDYLASHLKQVGGDAVLTISPNEVLTLRNTLVASLTRDDVTV